MSDEVHQVHVHDMHTVQIAKAVAEHVTASVQELLQNYLPPRLPQQIAALQHDMESLNQVVSTLRVDLVPYLAMASQSSTVKSVAFSASEKEAMAAIVAAEKESELNNPDGLIDPELAQRKLAKKDVGLDIFPNEEVDKNRFKSRCREIAKRYLDLGKSWAQQKAADRSYAVRMAAALTGANEDDVTERLKRYLTNFKSYRKKENEGADKLDEEDKSGDPKDKVVGRKRPMVHNTVGGMGATDASGLLQIGHLDDRDKGLLVLPMDDNRTKRSRIV